MIVTEEEARFKRCQESFGDGNVTPQGHMVAVHAVGGSTPFGTSPSMCIASACMAWRRRWRIVGPDGSPHNDRIFSSEPKGLVDGLTPQALGYCGKAGAL